jgi:hypothetical protein
MILNALTRSNKKMKDPNHYLAVGQVRIRESEQNRDFDNPFCAAIEILKTRSLKTKQNQLIF